MLNTLNEIESHLNHITDPTHQKMTLTNCSSKQFVDAHNNTCDALHTMLAAQRVFLSCLKVMNSRLPQQPWKQEADVERYPSGLPKESTELWHPKQQADRWTVEGPIIPRDGKTISYGLPHIDTEAEAMQLLMKCGYLCRCLTPLPHTEKTHKHCTFPAWCSVCRRVIPFDPDEREEPTR